MKKMFAIAAMATVVALSVWQPVQAAGTFTRDNEVIAQWLDANAAQFVVWCEANLSQAQINALETMMFPEPEPETAVEFLDRIRQVYQESGIDLNATAERQAFRDAYIALYNAEKENMEP